MPHECKQEQRLQQLERQEAVMGVRMEDLINRLGELTTWIKFLICTLLTTGLTAFGYLIVKWVEK
jgi:hypothetical protein